MVNDNIQAPVTDQSHGHTYHIYPGASFNHNVGATVGSSDAPGMSANKPPRPHRRCPAPSRHYTRREGIEKHMDSYFFERKRGQKCYVLHGLGGSGKTEAAKAFVYRHYYDAMGTEDQRFSDAFWVDATSTETISESLQDIAEAVGIKIDDVLSWFANRDGPGDDRNWIILFNNADDPELDLSTYFPDCSHGNILITTRSREAIRFGVGSRSAYGVSSMTEGESQSVLVSHLRIEDPFSSTVIDDIADLAQELGHFPLSLGQAGAFIAKTHFTPRKYLTMLRTRRDELLAEQGKMKNPDKYEYTSIQAAWLISFEKLSPLARQLLRFCAFLHHDGILQTIFEYMPTGLDNYERWYSQFLTDDERAAIARLKEFCRELSTDGSWNEFKFHMLIGELESFSLILYNPERGSWSLHPLVHEWAGNTLTEDDRIIMRQEVLILLSSGRGRTDEERVFDGLLALHVDEVLKGGVVEFNGCRNELAFVYKAARRWEDVAGLRTEYKEECERILGRDDEETVYSMANLAATYHKQGRLEDAATLQLEVMDTQKRKLGVDHLETLQSMANLAGTYRKQGRLEDAATLESEVMDTRKRKLGDDHLETLESMANLAATYHKQGRLEDAATLQLEVMDTRKRKLGEDHLETLESMANLAVTYYQQGRLEDAARLELEVMDTRKRKLGEDHLETLESMANLAGTYHKQGRLEDAATLELEVMDTRKRKLGDDHLETLKSMANLAVTYYQQGRLEDAATLELEVMDTRKRKLGEDHLETLQSMANLAGTYHKQGRLEDAARLQLEVMDTRKRKLGDDHLETLESMANLAATYHKQGRLEDAATLQLEVMGTRKRKLGEDHLETLQSMANLSVTYWKQGRLEDAATLQLEVMETRKRKLGEDHLETLQSMANLAATYRKQGRLEDAAALQSQAVEGLTQKLGNAHSDTCTAKQTLEAIHQDIEVRNHKTANATAPSTQSNKQSGSNNQSRRARVFRHFREILRKPRAT